MNPTFFLYRLIQQVHKCHPGGPNPRHLGTWTFRYRLGHLGIGHFGTDLDISVLGTGQFGTWMRQYSVLTTIVWTLLPQSIHGYSFILQFESQIRVTLYYISAWQIFLKIKFRLYRLLKSNKRLKHWSMIKEITFGN